MCNDEKSVLLRRNKEAVCCRYLDIMSSSAFWWSSSALLNSLFSACISLKCLFSLWIPAINCKCDLCFASVFKISTSSWYYDHRNDNRVTQYTSVCRNPNTNTSTCFMLSICPQTASTSLIRVSAVFSWSEIRMTSFLASSMICWNVNDICKMHIDSTYRQSGT